MMSQSQSCCVSEKNNDSAIKSAVLYRVVMDDYICPYGLKALELLKSQKYEVNDIHFTSQHEAQAFKEKHHLNTTVHILINDELIDGYHNLQKLLSEDKQVDQEGYHSILKIFLLSFIMSVTVNLTFLDTLDYINVFHLFMAFSICILSSLKLKDIQSFSDQFVRYDMLAQKWRQYGHIYPYTEALSGIGMMMIMTPGILTLAAGSVSFLAGTIGTISVFKAVYIEKQNLKCACIGGKSNVPLSFVSLMENLMMVFMGGWMLVININ